MPAVKESAYDCVGIISARCYPSPEWRHTASVSYDSNEWWSTTLRWRHFGGIDYAGSADNKIAQKELEDGENYFDLNAVFRFMGNHDVVVGINNLLDEEPPMSGLSTNANTIAGFYDTLGRYLYANMTLRW